jgi:ribosomal-protein-alanine N-acetyltransferase
MQELTALRLESERLVLQGSSAAMADALPGYLERNRAHFAASGPRAPATFTSERCRAALIEEEQQARAGSSVRLYLFPRGAPDAPIIGNVSFTNIVRGVFQACHLGFRIDQDYQGHGLMREALTVSLAFAFNELGLHRVMANYRPENQRSGRLLRRLGFAVEGYARDYLLLDGQWRDHILTSLINPGVGAAAAET